MAFSTHLRDQAIAHRQALLEQTRQKVLARTLQMLDECGVQHDIQRAYLFGSVTRPGRFREQSDVDIAVDVSGDGFDLPEAIAGFSRYLQRDVDLVEMSKIHFAHRIREKGILWTAQNL